MTDLWSNCLVFNGKEVMVIKTMVDGELYCFSHCAEIGAVHMLHEFMQQHRHPVPEMSKQDLALNWIKSGDEDDPRRLSLVATTTPGVYQLQYF